MITKFPYECIHKESKRRFTPIRIDYDSRQVWWQKGQASDNGEWLSFDEVTFEKINTFFDLAGSKPVINDLLPDIYSGELNTKRIKDYRKLLELYTIQEGTIRDIFCKGADWYKDILRAELIVKNNSIFSKRIKDLPLSVRAKNCLTYYSKLNTLGDLLQYSRTDLRKFRCLGLKTLVEIIEYLDKNDLQLKQEE